MLYVKLCQVMLDWPSHGGGARAERPIRRFLLTQPVEVMAATKLKSSPSPRRVTGKEPELMADEARRILRAEMIRCGFSFKMLAKALAEQQGGRAHRVGSIFDEQGEPGAVFLRVFCGLPGRWACRL